MAVATRVTPCSIVIVNSGLVVVSRCIAMMYGWLVQTTISIVGSVLVVIATLVGHKHRRTSLVEMAYVKLKKLRIYCATIRPWWFQR